MSIRWNSRLLACARMLAVRTLLAAVLISLSRRFVSGSGYSSLKGWSLGGVGSRYAVYILRVCWSMPQNALYSLLAFVWVLNQLVVFPVSAGSLFPDGSCLFVIPVLSIVGRCLHQCLSGSEVISFVHCITSKCYHIYHIKTL